jgi:hypothetical protein
MLLMVGVAGYAWKSGWFSSRYQSKVYRESTGWSFDITDQGQPFIYQPVIPGLPGKNGFSSAEDAQKVADLMIRKLKRHQGPPSVSVTELRELGIQEASRVP